jgi:hypothetical protein
MERGEVKQGEQTGPEAAGPLSTTAARVFWPYGHLLYERRLREYRVLGYAVFEISPRGAEG